MISPEKPLWPFSERNGVNASEFVAELQAAPGTPLAPDELALAYDFAEKLAGGFLNPNLTASIDGYEPARSLAEINETSLTATNSIFYLDYFKTANGRSDARELGLEPRDFDSLAEQLYALPLAGNVPDVKTREQFASNSLDWYKAELTRRLELDPAGDSIQPDSPRVRVNFEPDKLLDKFAELQAYRRFYREAGTMIKNEPDSRLVEAGRLLVEIHLARVNNLVAGLYPQLVDLASQINSLPLPETQKTNAWREKLAKIAPIAALALDSSPDFAPNFARRLDLVRNGAERYETGQNFLPISKSVGSLATELESASDEEAPASQLAPAVLEALESTSWNANQFAEFLEATLADWELLSEEKITWHEASERSGRASDDKWQVVITPEVSALSASGIKKIVKVPKKFYRTLALALPKVAHELAHVLQQEFSDKLAEMLPLAGIKGRRYVTGREMGSIYYERGFLAQIGKNRPVNTTYLRALETKLAGKNQTEAARAFASVSRLKSRNTDAGKNVLRHYRYGGYDSQALDYIEQELQLRALAALPAERQRALAIACGSFNLAEAAALHRFGMFEIPDEVDKSPAEDVLRIYLEKFA